MDLALNNLQRLICHKTQQTKPNQTKQNKETLIIQIGEMFSVKIDIHRFIHFDCSLVWYIAGDFGHEIVK